MYDSDDDDDYEEYEEEDSANWTEPCPNCGEMVYEDSPRCPACGDYIVHRRGPFSGKPLWFFLLILGIVAWLIISML